MDKYNWEEFLYQLGKRGEPADFKAFLSEYGRHPSIEPEMLAAVYPMITASDIAKTMLAAALQLPPEEAKRTLDQIAGVVPSAAFRKRLNKELSRQQREWHQTVVHMFRYTVIPGTSALVATFRTYIRGDYDLAKDPNELIREAIRLVDEDRERALELIGEAGALALRGKELWARWPDEVDPPLHNWLLVLDGFVGHLREKPEVYPLGAIEDEREDWLETLRILEEKPEPELSEEAKARDPAYGGELFDELEPFLYGGRQIRAEEIAKLPKPPEEYADLVLHSVRAWDRWDYSEVGTEELLMNMMAILGELQYEAAVEPLLDVVAGTVDSELFDMADEATYALANIGEPALEPLLDFVRYSDDDLARVELAETLAKVGRDDPRTFEVLAQLFQEVPWYLGEWGMGKLDVAEAFATLGDQRAIPLLEAALKDPDADYHDKQMIETALYNLRAE